jgi:hypothetical protein
MFIAQQIVGNNVHELAKGGLGISFFFPTGPYFAAAITM